MAVVEDVGVMDSKFKLEWDYLGYQKYAHTESLDFEYWQNDWNQTLITCINQLSAKIHVEKGVGVNLIKTNTKCFKILKSSMFFGVTDDGIFNIDNRYKIVIDTTLPINKIHVMNDEIEDLVGEITVLNNDDFWFPVAGSNKGILLSENLIEDSKVLVHKHNHPVRRTYKVYVGGNKNEENIFSKIIKRFKKK